MTYFPSAGEAVTESPTEPAERVTDEARHEEMSAIYDSLNGPEAKEAEAKAQPPMPQYRGTEKSLHSAFERTADWMDKPLEERREEATAHRLVEKYKADIGKFGLSPSEFELLVQRSAQLAPEWHSFVESAAKAAPGQKPHELAGRLLEYGNWYERDTPAFLQALATEKGYRISLDRVGYGADDYADAEAVVNAFSQSAPDFAELEDDIAAALHGGHVQVTYDKQATLQAAYQYAKAKRANSKSRQRAYRPGDNLRARMAANWPGGR